MRAVPAFDVAEEDEPGVRMRREAMLREAFTLERGEETLDHGVIVRIASRAHGRLHAEQLTPLPEGKGSVLGGFNRSSQHRVVRQTIDGRSVPLPASSILTFCAASY